MQYRGTANDCRAQLLLVRTDELRTFIDIGPDRARGFLITAGVAFPLVFIEFLTGQFQESQNVKMPATWWLLVQGAFYS